MKKLFQSVFNYETLVSALIGAIGYGSGYVVTSNYGYPMIICIFTSFLLGFIFDALAEKIIAVKAIKESKRDRVLLVIIIYIIYFMCSLAIHRIFNYDIDDDLLFDIGFIILFQIVTMISQYIKKRYKQSKKNK